MSFLLLFVSISEGSLLTTVKKKNIKLQIWIRIGIKERILAVSIRFPIRVKHPKLFITV